MVQPAAARDHAVDEDAHHHIAAGLPRALPIVNQRASLLER
jgi:hypothetical protein